MTDKVELDAASHDFFEKMRGAGHDLHLIADALLSKGAEVKALAVAADTAASTETPPKAQTATTPPAA